MARNFASKPLCQTLSNALLMSKKTILISLLSSMALANSLEKYASWLMVESVGLNPDWYSEMIVFSSRYSKCIYAHSAPLFYLHNSVRKWAYNYWVYKDYLF